MKKILLKFTVDLHSTDNIGENEGPSFHRWLPNGQNDAIDLPTGSSDISIKIWFERLGYVSNDFIHYDKSKKEVNPDLIPTQGIINVGPIYGSIEGMDISESEFEAVTKDKIGDSDYISLGKRIIELLNPGISKFINIIRITYGQYWLQEFKKWDSRESDVGSFCNSIDLMWSQDGDSWHKFSPELSGLYLDSKLESRREKYLQYLTENDWKTIGILVQDEYEPLISSEFLTQCQSLLDKGQYGRALIEGVTALEIALNEFMMHKVGVSSLLKEKLHTFNRGHLITKVIFVTPQLKNLSPNEIENTIKAIDMRNKVVHEGYVFTKDKSEKVISQLESLQKTVIALLNEFDHKKLPSIPRGQNICMKIDDWEKAEY